MKCRFNRRTAGAALGLVSTVAAKADGAAGGVHLEVDDFGRVVLTCTGHATASTWIEGDVDETGVAVLPIPQLAAVLANADAEVVELELGSKRDNYRLTAGTFEAALSGYPPRDFPPVALEDAIETIQVDAEHLRRAIRSAAPFVSDDESRPGVYCLCLRVDGDGVFFACGTDGHRLGVVNPSANRREQWGREWLIPSPLVPLLVAAVKLAGDDLEVRVGTLTSSIALEIGRTKIVGHYDAGVTYPDISRVIPVPGEDFTVDRATLAATVRRVAALSDRTKTRPDVELHALADALVIRAVGHYGTATDRVEYRRRGDFPEVILGVNVRYLLEAIGTFDAAEIRLQVVDPFHPIAIRDDDPSNLQVVMPMRL